MSRMVTRLQAVPLTAYLAGLAIGLMASPACQTLLELDREAVAAGQVWRLLTGHFTHWNFEHLFWDALMFVCLGLICQRRGWLITAGLIAGSAFAISLSFLRFESSLASYRGLSGIDSALFAMALACLAADHYRRKNWPWLAGIIALFAGFVGKVSYELLSRETLFVDADAAGFTPLPLAHVVGAACGLVAAIVAQSGSRPPTTSGHPASLLLLGQRNAAKTAEVTEV